MVRRAWVECHYWQDINLDSTFGESSIQALLNRLERKSTLSIPWPLTNYCIVSAWVFFFQEIVFGCVQENSIKTARSLVAR